MIQDAINATLPRLRAQAEARMVSRAKVRRKTGKNAQNPTTGREDPVWTVEHTDLPFRLGGSPRGYSPTRTLRVAGVEREVAVRVGNMPFFTDNLRDGDLIEITAGENAGLVVQIVEATGQDQATARRVPVFEVQRPSEWG